MDILLIPFWTDTKNAYSGCGAAPVPAIENECYVAIAGSVGNIPKVENMDIHYAPASRHLHPFGLRLSPRRRGGGATPNTEMALIADLDVELLKELRAPGSVRTCQAAGRNLYWIDWLKEKEREEEECSEKGRAPEGPAFVRCCPYYSAMLPRCLARKRSMAR